MVCVFLKVINRGERNTKIECEKPRDWSRARADRKKMFVVANRNGILQGLNDYPTVLEFINLCRMIHQEEDG